MKENINKWSKSMYQKEKRPISKTGQHNHIDWFESIKLISSVEVMMKVTKDHVISNKNHPPTGYLAINCYCWIWLGLRGCVS